MEADMLEAFTPVVFTPVALIRDFFMPGEASRFLPE